MHTVNNKFVILVLCNSLVTNLNSTATYWLHIYVAHPLLLLTGTRKQRDERPR